jgi:hypothetical protein
MKQVLNIEKRKLNEWPKAYLRSFSKIRWVQFHLHPGNIVFSGTYAEL